MYCQYCGSELPEGTKFCTNCGKPVGVAGQDSWQQKADKAAAAMGSFADEAMDTLNSAGKAVDSAISDIESEFRGGTTYYGAPLKEDRSLLVYILLNFVTCGIYGYYFIYSVAKDVNTACEDDDEETAGLGLFILLSIITCGFYGLYWEYKLGNRLARNAASYGIDMQENGTTILLWRIFGAFICVVGTFVGSYILIKNVNAVCTAYNDRYFA